MNTVDVDQLNNLFVLCSILCNAGAAITNENNMSLILYTFVSN